MTSPSDKIAETTPPPYHQLTAKQALEAVEGRAEGLDEAQVKQRLEQFGHNHLTLSKPLPRWRLLVRQFHNLLIYVLLAAAVATALLQHWVDTAVILGVVVINGLIGFIQEGKAEKALEAVRNLLAPKATVIRADQQQVIDAAELVPGDIILFKSGDRIAADARLLDTKELRIDEALLTGESVPVDKELEPIEGDPAIAERSNMVWSGTLVAAGKGKAVVIGTGKNTEIGRVSELLAGVTSLTTPLLRQLEKFGRQLTIGIAAMAAACFALGYWWQDYSASEMFMAAVGLAVAAIPEGLPAVVTIILALGVQKMAGSNAIVRRLPAVETLGSVTVICSDKTGTLTRNEMTATALQLHQQKHDIGGTGYNTDGAINPAPGEDAQMLMRTAMLCNDAALKQEGETWQVQGEPTEMALALVAVKGGMDPNQEEQQWPRKDVIPFESKHKYMATLHHHQSDGSAVILMKGAPEAVLERCSQQLQADGEQPLDADYWQQAVDQLARSGLRTLALAQKSVTTDTALSHDELEGCTLLGLIGLIDPPRPEAIEAVAMCQRAGIQVKMITGDHAGTATAIAQQLGMQEGAALTGKELDAMDENQLRDCVQDTAIFARVSPENKLQLVTALQKQGHVVAMTGDGVNDAPALKRADIGVAMGNRGTEAAKEASEIVLADDNFASIGKAVKQGRTVYANIQKSITFIAPTNGGQALTILAAVLVGMTIPVTPLHILWVNMVTAVTLALALAFEHSEPDIMQQPPRNPKAGLVSGFMLWRIAFVSVLIVGMTFGLFHWALAQGAELATARTLAVNTIVVLEIFYLFNARFLTASSMSIQGLIGNIYCWYAVAAVVILQLLFTYSPWLQTLFDTRAISWQMWMIMVTGGVWLFMLIELEKWVIRRYLHRQA